MGEAVSGGLSIYFAPLPTPLIRSSASRLTGCGRGIFFPFLLFFRRYCAAISETLRHAMLRATPIGLAATTTPAMQSPWQCASSVMPNGAVVNTVCCQA